MAAASLVATAIGILLLIITAYLLASGTISLTETMVTAEKDMTAVSSKITGTSISIWESAGTGPIYVTINNTGSEGFNDFASMDVFLQDSTNFPEYLGYNPEGGTGWQVWRIEPDTVYPNTWDPGEALTIQINAAGGPYIWVKVTTPTGVPASAYL